MKLQRGIRARLGGALLALTAAVAMLAVPGLASSHEGPAHDPPGDAGTIQSYDAGSGVLVVDLAEGDTISGLVVERTQIRCGKPPRKERRGRGHGGPASERPGPGEEGRPPKGQGPPPEQGEDSDPASGPPGQGEDGNDDPPGHDGTPPGASEDPGQGADHGKGRPPHCDEDDLVPGTVVKKAEIVLTDGNAYFRVICLPRPEKAPEEEPAPAPAEG